MQSGENRVGCRERELGLREEQDREEEDERKIETEKGNERVRKMERVGRGICDQCFSPACLGCMLDFICLSDPFISLLGCILSSKQQH